MKQLTKIWIFITIVWLLWWGIYLCTQWQNITMKPSEWGDFLAGVSAPLAFLWLVLGYYQQGEEIKTNTKVLSEQQKELNSQVKALGGLAHQVMRIADVNEKYLKHLKKVSEQE